MGNQPTMNDDLERYELFGVSNTGKLFPVENIKTTDDYNHFLFSVHHFVRKSMRKNYPDDYAKFEKYQKLIIMPNQMNLDLEIMGEINFLKTWKIPKWDLVFNRRKWREGYYDRT